MQSVGLTIEEIAIIYLALPFTTFLAPPITGKKGEWAFVRMRLNSCCTWIRIYVVRFGLQYIPSVSENQIRLLERNIC